MTEPTPTSSSKSHPKIRITFTILLAAVLIFVALIFVFWGSQIIGENNKKNWFQTTQGLASDSSQVDPHITKVYEEQNQVTNVAKNNNVGGIFQKISAGDYQYETLKHENLAQFTVENFYFFDTNENAVSAWEEMSVLMSELGYEQDPSVDPTETSASLIRQVVPADEMSDVSPGNDTVSLSMFTREPGVTVIVFLYTSTELTLGGIPAQDGEQFTVTQVEQMIEDVVNGTVDGCSLQPNGTTGGWVPDLGCYQQYL